MPVFTELAGFTLQRDRTGNKSINLFHKFHKCLLILRDLQPLRWEMVATHSLNEDWRKSPSELPQFGWSKRRTEYPFLVSTCSKSTNCLAGPIEDPRKPCDIITIFLMVLSGSARQQNILLALASSKYTLWLNMI